MFTNYNHYDSLREDEDISIIEKCNKQIKEEETIIENHKFNIDSFNYRKVSLVRGLIIPFSESVQNIRYINDFINLKRKEFIEKYDTEKYQIAKKEHDLLKMVIEDDVLGHGIKYDYKITEMIIGGYEHYYTSIYFTVYNIQSKTRNNTTFVFNLPHPKNIHLDNCVYANDGKYCLWYKKGCSLNLIKDSYYVNDIKKAFEEFIEGEDNNEI